MAQLNSTAVNGDLTVEQKIIAEDIQAKTANIPTITGDTFTGKASAAGVADSAETINNTLPISKGGTGATSDSAARTNLGLGKAATMDVGDTAGTVAKGDHNHDSKYVGIANEQTITGKKTFAVETNFPKGINFSCGTGEIPFKVNSQLRVTNLNADLLDGLHGDDYLREANLKWGGKNYSASYGPIDAAMIPALGANRFAFMPPEGIFVEQSRDNGSSWTPYKIPGVAENVNQMEIRSRLYNIFSGLEGSFVIGAAEGPDAESVNKSSSRLRITIDSLDCNIYTSLNKFCIYCSTRGSQNCWCTIEAKTRKNVLDNKDHWVTAAERVTIAGDSGYNIINIANIKQYPGEEAPPDLILCGYPSNSGQYQKLRFTFGGGFLPNSNGKGLQIKSIYGFGGVGWNTPSTLAKTGHLYSYDRKQDASFPSKVKATTFVENEINLADKYAPKSHTHNYAGSATSGGNATKADSITTTSGSDNIDRPVFFGYSNDNTRVVYNDNFKYNPSTKKLTAENIDVNSILFSKDHPAKIESSADGIKFCTPSRKISIASPSGEYSYSYSVPMMNGTIALQSDLNNRTTRVNLTGKLQTNSYRKSVIALCELGKDQVNLDSYSVGTISFHRTNGLAGTIILNVAIENAYTGEYFANASMYGNHNKDDDLRFCTFIYEGKHYGGLYCDISAAEFQEIVFNGETNFNIFGLDYYYYGQNQEVLNQEVNDSISFENINLKNTFKYNGIELSKEGHTHNYAGSDSPGGDATKAKAADYASVAGSAQRAGQLTSAHGDSKTPVYFNGNGEATPIESFSEANLSWGGKNFKEGYGPIDAAMIPILGSNKLAFLPRSSLKVESSRDNGATWTPYQPYGYSVNDARITKKLGDLYSGATIAEFRIGAADFNEPDILTKDKSSFQLRFIIDSLAANLYTVLNKFCIYCTDYGTDNAWCTIDARIRLDVINGTDRWIPIATQIPIGGWSGYNIINVNKVEQVYIPNQFNTPPNLLLCGGENSINQFQELRITFGGTHPANKKTIGLTIQNIYGFGGVGWGVPSKMARNGHLYSYDAFQNAEFPARVRATAFEGALNGNSTSATLAAKANSIATVVGTSDKSRPVFFGYDNDNSKVVYNNNFNYNPSTGTLSVKNVKYGMNTLSQNFRPDNNAFTTGFYYGNYSEEGLTLATASVNTSIQFINGQDPSKFSNRSWADITPGLQLKGNKVGIHHKLSASQYLSAELDVNGKLLVRGAAAEQHLQSRNLVGSNSADGLGELYLQYGNSTNDTVYFGKDGSNYINNNGSYYSGISSASKKVQDVDNNKPITLKYSGSNSIKNPEYYAVWNGYQVTFSSRKDVEFALTNGLRSYVESELANKVDYRSPTFKDSLLIQSSEGSYANPRIKFNMAANNAWTLGGTDYSFSLTRYNASGMSTAMHIAKDPQSSSGYSLFVGGKKASLEGHTHDWVETAGTVSHPLIISNGTTQWTYDGSKTVTASVNAETIAYYHAASYSSLPAASKAPSNAHYLVPNAQNPSLTDEYVPCDFDDSRHIAWKKVNFSNTIGTAVSSNGSIISTWNADGKLDKVTTTGPARVYGVGEHGTQQMYTVSKEPYAAFAIPQRTSSGSLVSKDPYEPDEVATKRYTDTLVGNSEQKMNAMKIDLDLTKKKVKNLEQQVSEELPRIDNWENSCKRVPLNVCKYAELQSFEGKTKICFNLTDYTKARARNSGQSLAIIKDGIKWTGDFYFYIPVSNVQVGKDYVCTYDSSVAGAWTFQYTDNDYAPSHKAGQVVRPEKPVKNVLIYKNDPSVAGSNMVFTNIMLNEGSTALPYEPYFDGLRGNGPTNFKSQGTNLFNPKEYVENDNPLIYKLKDNLVEVISSDGSAWGSKKPLKLKAGNYSLICNTDIDLRTPNGETIATLPPPHQTATRYITFTLQEDKEVAIKIGVYDTSGYPILAQLAIIKGVSTNYVPYSELDNYVVPQAIRDLPNYGQSFTEVNLSTKTYINRCNSIILDGTTHDVRYAEATKDGAYCVINLNPKGVGGSEGSAIVEGFTPKFAAKPGNSYVAVDGNLILFVANEFTDKASANAWLKAHPRRCVYMTQTSETQSIASIIQRDNFIATVPNGYITAENQYDYPVKSTIEYLPL